MTSINSTIYLWRIKFYFNINSEYEWNNDKPLFVLILKVNGRWNFGIDIYRKWLGLDSDNLIGAKSKFSKPVYELSFGRFVKVLTTERNTND